MAKARLTRAIKLYGTNVPDGKKRLLNAGPISAMLDNGALRYITYRGSEVLRGIAFLVRDKDWGTYVPVIEGLTVRQAKDGFSVHYIATCEDATQAIRYEATIRASAAGTVTFAATATPLTDVLTNRTGFVVLHPLAGVVGAAVEIVHTDGRKEKSRFPRLISPGQPVFEIRSLKHEVMPGVSATVLMEGNKFEMEDHRNWMDASYKTYVCSLLDPWPYTLKKGETFTQSITVTIAGKPAAKKIAKSGGAIAVTVGGTRGRIPMIGAGIQMKDAQGALDSVKLVANAKPYYLVCQIDGRLGGQAEAARAYQHIKEMTGAYIDLEIILPARDSAADEITRIAAGVRDGGLFPDAVIVTQVHDLKSFQPGAPRPWGPSYEEMAAAVRERFPGVPLGGGMLSYFTELNRKRPPSGLFDFLTHTVCPIVHAADDISVMETLESLPSIFASAKAIAGKTDYDIGPSSIPCRDNPYGAGVAANRGDARVCLSDRDPRQRGLFAAAWTLGLAARAAEAGLHAIALGSLTGAQGAIYRKADHIQPWYDEGQGEVFPVYHVLAGLSPASKAARLQTACSAPEKLALLAYRRRAGCVMWLANLTTQAQKAKISGFDGAAQIHRLSDGTFQKIAQHPDYLSSSGEAVKKVSAVELGPYEVVNISSSN